MFWGPHHLWGQVLGAHHLCWIKAKSPCSQLAPLTPNGQGRVGVCYTMFWGPHHLCGGKGIGGKLGARGASWEQEEQAGSERSEPNVILGFRVPTTIGRKKIQ